MVPSTLAFVESCRVYGGEGANGLITPPAPVVPAGTVCSHKMYMPYVPLQPKQDCELPPGWTVLPKRLILWP